MTTVADALDLWAEAPASFTSYRTAVLAYRLWRTTFDGQTNPLGYPVGVLDQWAALAYAPQREAPPKAAWAQWQTDHATPTTQVGIYAWPTDYTGAGIADMIASWGITTMRIAHDRMNQTCADTLTAHNVTAFVTVSADRGIAEFATEQGWINAYLAQVDTALSFGCFDAIEVCNEPFISTKYGTGFRDRGVHYGALLIATAAHVRANWPSVTIAAFSLTGSKTSPRDYIDYTLSAHPEAVTAFDVVTMHPYTNPLPPDVTQPNGDGWTPASQTTDVRAIVAQYGGPTDIGVWYTEAGWNVTPGTGTLDGAYNATPGRSVTPEQQADYSVRLIDVANANRIGRLTFMYVKDVVGQGNFGWVRNGQPRPIAQAVHNRLAS